MKNFQQLIKELISYPKETEWLEFKHNNFDPSMIGERISALANSTTLIGRDQAYIVWGIDDKTHQILGTDISLSQQRKGNEELESWLRHQLSPNAEFQMCSTEVDGKNIEFIMINKAIAYPVEFGKEVYIRIGSYTKKLRDYREKQATLFEKLRAISIEDTPAMTDLPLGEVRQRLSCDAYFKAVKIPLPKDEGGYAHPLMEEGLIKKQDNGLYTITYLGAILLATRLADFPRVGRKAIRIIQYEGTDKSQIARNKDVEFGYVEGFIKSIETIQDWLPSQERIQVTRQTIHPYPVEAIREALANALIHQDLSQTGNGPMVEIFRNRIEILNPGAPLIEPRRIVDNPPRSRNEKLAALMRRMGFCEEAGSGWDRMVKACEHDYLPAPRINSYEASTQVTLFSHLDYRSISHEDRIWSAYLHACIRHIEGESLLNSSLRARFGLAESYAASISRLIKDTVEEGLIKPLDPNIGKKHMRYIPFWG